MRSQARKVTPKVVRGKVQKKNSHAITFNYWDHDPGYPVIDRQRPGAGRRHLLNKADIQKFIDILPDWDELSKGLKAVVLAPGERGLYGWFEDGVIGICAWERDLWHELSRKFYRANSAIFGRLDVQVEELPDGDFLVKFTENQAKAFQLLDVFLHELGHHHDRMTTKRKMYGDRGESYAEAYATRYMHAIWCEYLKRFPLY